MTTHVRDVPPIFQVRAVDGFDDGSWWWELYADGDFLDGGGWASDPYRSYQDALDTGERLIRDSDDFKLVARGMTPAPRPARRTFATSKMTDPREVVASSWVTRPYGKRVTHLTNAGPSCVTFYAIQPDWSAHARVVSLDEPPLWDRLMVPMAHEKLGRQGADDSFVVEPLEMRSVFDESVGAQVRAPDAGDLAEINAHRRRLGMRPLDPAAAGWTADDVRLEARRIRALNPAMLAREAALAW